jgi:hypothetical protein
LTFEKIGQRRRIDSLPEQRWLQLDYDISLQFKRNTKCIRFGCFNRSQTKRHGGGNVVVTRRMQEKPKNGISHTLCETFRSPRVSRVVVVASGFFGHFDLYLKLDIVCSAKGIYSKRKKTTEKDTERSFLSSRLELEQVKGLMLLNSDNLLFLINE